MAGVLAYAAYVPCHRVNLGRRARAVAGADEDSTTMAVAAARAALRPGTPAPDLLLLATTSPAYLDKTNATAVHAALALPAAVSALDLGAAPRSGAGAVRLGLRQPGTTLALLSDIRTGRSGSTDEREGGDAAAALLLTGDDVPVLAEVLSEASATAEHLERWRLPAEHVSHRWDDSFAADAAAPLAEQALTAALKDACVTADDVDVLVVAGFSTKVVHRVAAQSGVRADARLVELADVGSVGTAQIGLLLAAALDRAVPGDVVALITIGDGVEAAVLRATALLAEHRSNLRAQLDGPHRQVRYTDWLGWRGMLQVEPSRAAAPRGISAPAAAREREWKFALTGSRCRGCGTRHLPPQRICLSCQSELMDPEPLGASLGTVVTCSTDRLAWSCAGPAVFAIVDLDGGGRIEVEATDANHLSRGQRVELVFRRLHTADARHNYFWKACPVQIEQEI
jgi:hydroxymethylglutaryl-CoA synthase